MHRYYYNTAIMASIVLKIVEYYVKPASIETFGSLCTTTYVYYDNDKREFGIHGIRHHKVDSKEEKYSFYSTFQGALQFLKFSFEQYSNASVCLMNYDELPYYSEDIDIETLATTPSNEIVGYDEKNSKTIDFKKLLIIISNLYDY